MNEKKKRNTKEEKKMSVLEKNITGTDRELLFKIAEKNTKRNVNGDTVCTKDCPYREEVNWKKTIKKVE